MSTISPSGLVTVVTVYRAAGGGGSAQADNREGERTQGLTFKSDTSALVTATGTM